MNFRPTIDFASLPAGLRTQLVETDFLDAFESEIGGNIIVWIKNPNARGQLEIEYSRASHRLLSRPEREALFPPLAEVRLASLGARVTVGHAISDDNGTLLQTYDVKSIGSDATSLRCQQMVYVPIMRPLEDVVGDKLTAASFPARYAGWTADDKIDYWVVNLYRQRRQAGENGQDEDIVFSSGLLGDMRRTDPDIGTILPSILTNLALMEQRKVDQLFASFSARTGTAVSG